MLSFIYHNAIIFVIGQPWSFLSGRYNQLIFGESYSLKLRKLGSQMSRDHHNCCNCVKFTNYSEFRNLEQLFKNQDVSLEVLNEMKYNRLSSYSLLNMINLTVIFIIYEEPNFSTAITIIISSLIFRSIYIEDTKQIYLFRFNNHLIIAGASR